MAKSGEKELKTKYPIEEGLTAKTQKQEGRTSNLIAQNSNVNDKRRKGL